MTQMLIVADVKRSVSFYRDVLGGTVLREHSPRCFGSTTAGSSSTAAADRRQTSPR
jgi:catechol 2,3-dioxygenase-like lactoylglutathione lyase family enzyme